MKLIGSWKAKYIGFEANMMAYYVGWTHPEVRHWGYEQDYYDGPIHRFGLWFIDFHWHYDTL